MVSLQLDGWAGLVKLYLKVDAAGAVEARKKTVVYSYDENSELVDYWVSERIYAPDGTLIEIIKQYRAEEQKQNKTERWNQFGARRAAVRKCRSAARIQYKSFYQSESMKRFLYGLLTL